MKNCFGKLVRMAFLAATFSLVAWSSKAETDPYWYAVQVSAAIQTAPPQIELSWPADSNATGYSVYRKAFNAISWTSLGSLPANATTFPDVDVTLGGAYEYAIKKSTSLGFTGTGYIYAGINAPMIESRGKLVLVVDNTYATQLATELATLEQDLIGDGWTVIRHDVARTATVASIKSIIKADYTADSTNVKSVFLFGHIAVPYSGNFNPDGHPDHQGAWPADAFYADMDGAWTDSSVNTTTAARPENQNVPSDGKFDQSSLPSDVELELGRVDLANMTCFSNKTPSRNELDLLRQYLNKDHNFRQGKISVQRRGIVCDNFGERSGEAFASSGWRNFAAFFGASKVTATPGWTFFTTLSTQDYLWAYGTGGGSFTTCDGVGGSDNFATTDLHAVFTMFLGSYFGDWDNESAFLRAPLGSTSYTLTSSWAGRPHWFYHHMGLGQTIGYSTRLTQNNAGGGALYQNQINYAARGVHVALMGDPSLRMHPVIPPSNLGATIGGTGVGLTWAASTDTGIQGYYVYRSSSAKGPFTRISGTTPVVTLAYNDVTGASGQTYMVRAVKLEQSGGGSYYNPSQGLFLTAGGVPIPTVPATPSALTATTPSSSQINLTWSLNSANETGVKIFRKTGPNGTYTQIKSLAAGTKAFNDTGLAAATQYYYKVAAFNVVGDSAFSSEASSTTSAAPLQASASFIRSDTTSQGTWKSVYGSEGYFLVGDGIKTPAYAQVNGYLNYQFFWSRSTTVPAALQKAAASDRIAACWSNTPSFDIILTFKDANIHRVAAYFVDFDGNGRQQTVDVIDANTGIVLNTQTLSGFQNGKYLIYDLKGKVIIRSRRVAGNSAVMSGLFFDPSPAGAVSAPNAVRYLGQNTTTLGNWQGAFGSQGYNIIGYSASNPSFATTTAANKSDYIWIDNTIDPDALQKPSATDRIAACWYSSTAFTVNVTIRDGQTHKVSVYLLDWDSSGRAQTIDVLDGTTGAILHTVTASAFTSGRYVSWDVKGNVTFRVTRTAGNNALINGLFFDPPSAAL